VTVNLARVGQLKEALSNFRRRTVNLVDEEDDGRGAREGEPIGRVPSGDALPADLRIARVGQTKKVAFGHLRSAAFHDGKAKVAGGLVDDLGLADAVTTAKKDGLANLRDEGREGDEGSEIDGHGVNSSKERVDGSVEELRPSTLKNIAHRGLKVKDFF
jgi:hypothetical protein